MQSDREAETGILEAVRSLIWSLITIGGLFSESRPALLVKPTPNESFSRTNRADIPTHIPQYVLDYTPYCYLYSGEEYWPGKMEVHLNHITPHLDYNKVPEEFQYPTLDDLDKLNYLGRNVFLQSRDDPESYPDWIAGSDNIPNDPNY
jgi:hypothetical protein